MRRRPPSSTRTDTLFPYTTLFRAMPSTAQLPMPRLSELVLAFRDIMERVSLYKHHEISREPLSVRERMTHILSRIQRGPAALSELVDPEEGRSEERRVGKECVSTV